MIHFYLVLVTFFISIESSAQSRFEAEIQDCHENLEESKKDTTARTQLSEYFCKGKLIAKPTEDWRCEPFSPRPMLCEESYFRCRRFYECQKETAEYNREKIKQSFNQ